MMEELKAGLRFVADQLSEPERTRLGAILSDDKGLARVVEHLRMVAEANQTMNLTAIKEPHEMVIKHAVDSAACVAVAPVGVQSWLDIGTGAGFPGLTAAALLPEVQFTLLDSVQKKLLFVQKVAEMLFSGNTPVTLWGRAEDLAQGKHREQYEVVSARAVASLRVLAEYALPFVRLGGLWIALKGPGADIELAEARHAIEQLGGGGARVLPFHLPHEMGERALVIVQKVRRTPAQYPRRAGIPERKPL